MPDLLHRVPPRALQVVETQFDPRLELEMERTRPGRWFVVSFRETHVDGRRPAVADHLDAEGFPFLVPERFPDVSHILDRVAIDRLRRTPQNYSEGGVCFSL